MITKVTFGAPLQTDAITANVAEAGSVAHFAAKPTGSGVEFTCPLHPDDIVYGLGETMGRVNKRGGRYISFNTDTAEHEEKRHPGGCLLPQQRGRSLPGGRVAGNDPFPGFSQLQCPPVVR